jgi:GxxExxY protein
MVSPEQERIAKIVLDAAFEVHSYMEPGLLESAYQTCLSAELKERGIFNVRSFEDGIRRIVLNDKKTFSTSSTLRLKNSAGQV